MSGKEFVEITVLVPKNLVQLVQDRNYFSIKPEEFWSYCVRCGIDAELNELDIYELKAVKEKYGLEPGSTINVDKRE